MEGAEAMLRMVGREDRVEGGEQQTLQHFGAGAQEGDWAVRFGLVTWFSWFEDGNDVRMFPDCWKFGSLNGDIADFGEVGDAQLSEVFEVEDREVVWTRSC